MRARSTTRSPVTLVPPRSIRATTGPDTVSWRSLRMLARNCDSCALAVNSGPCGVQLPSPYASRVPPLAPPSSLPRSRNSSTTSRWPASCARRRPLRISMPSTTERSARSSARRGPESSGCARLPAIAMSALNDPRRRQPGGASSDHTPMRGSWACTRPASGACAGHSQPPSPLRTSRVRSCPSARPARSLSHSSASTSCSPWLLTVSRASRTPALTRAAAPSTLSASTVTSPRTRASEASTRTVFPSWAFHWASNTMSPDSAEPASCWPPTSSSHAIGRPARRPEVDSCPPCRRTGDQDSNASVAGAPPDKAGARNTASPADTSKLPPAARQSTARRSCSCQGPGVMPGSCICTASEATWPRQLLAAAPRVPPSRPWVARSNLRCPRSACARRSSAASRRRPFTCTDASRTTHTGGALPCWSWVPPMRCPCRSRAPAPRDRASHPARRPGLAPGHAARAPRAGR
jgi:hypothetical protein